MNKKIQARGLLAILMAIKDFLATLTVVTIFISLIIVIILQHKHQQHLSRKIDSLRDYSDVNGLLNFASNQDLAKGESEMKKHKVIIAGISRNNAIELPNVIKSIEKTGQLFEDYQVVIFENDLTDGTKEIFQKWSKNNPKVKLISKK